MPEKSVVHVFRIEDVDQVEDVDFVFVGMQPEAPSYRLYDYLLGLERVREYDVEYGVYRDSCGKRSVNTRRLRP